ncbi:hypothetical protein DFH29DRAFT_1071474, partial [Suillus ampliporus]
MPPRGQRKGKGGGKKGGTTENAGGSSLHLDTRPVQAEAPKHDIGKETQRLDTEVAKCKAGVAWIDLLEMGDRLKFGVYNDRPENDTETNKLVGSFKSSGIVPMKDTSAIPLILDIKRVKNVKTLGNDFTVPDDVPELQLKDSAKIVVASGQHRLSALRRYYQSLEDEYQALEKKRTKITNLKHPSEEHVQSFNEMRDEMCSIKGVMEGVGKWGVVIYDQGKLLAGGDELACHLSRNNTLHEYKETEEEVLITILKKIKSVYDVSPEDKRDERAMKTLIEIRAIQDKNSRLQRVLQQDALCLFLSTRLLQLGPHIRRRPEYTVTWLAQAIDVCMGVYLSWIEIRTVTLKKLGSHKDFPSYKKVSDLLDDAGAGDQKSIDAIEELRKSIDEAHKEGEEGDLSMWAEVMKAMNNHATAAFGEISSSIGQMTPKYVQHLSSYRQNVVNTLQEVWAIGPDKDYGENEILKHLDRVVARVAVHLTPKEGEREAPEPLLGAFMMDYAWSVFTKLEEGIAELCRWFEVLLDSWRVVHPKAHTMDDWSTVMLSNIGRDPRFNGNHTRNTRALTKIIWKHRDTLMLRLTNYMTNDKNLRHPRAKDRKALDAEFDALPENEIIASDALTKVLLSKRAGKSGMRNRNLAMEPQSIGGMMALHTTGWDWQSPAIKNTARDIEPCMRAIAVERVYMGTYRPKLLRDKLVGALRRLIEVELGSRVRKLQTLDSAGKLHVVQEWEWWDGITLQTTQLDAEVVLQSLRDTT